MHSERGLHDNDLELNRPDGNDARERLESKAERNAPTDLFKHFLWSAEAKQAVVRNRCLSRLRSHSLLTALTIQQKADQ